MKLKLSTLLIILLCAGCSSATPEEMFVEQVDYKTELDSLLQTEQVRNQQLTLHLENLDTQIINFERDRDNPNVESYVTIVENYAADMSTGLSELNAFITQYRNDEQLNVGDITDTRDDIVQIAETYESEVSELELTEVLEREHSNIILANEEISAAVIQIADALAAADDTLLDESVERLHQATEYL